MPEFNMPMGANEIELRADRERHNSYGWIKPTADACYLCGKKEYATPVDGFQVRECERCERSVCQECAEIDCGGEGEGVSWICDSLKGGCRRDYSAEFEMFCNESCAKLADELEAIDRKHGVRPYDYSALRSR